MQLARYSPLFVLVAVAALGAFALSLDSFSHRVDWMRFFMGLLFCQFSMLKLFNLSQFVEGFQMYDWIAKRSRSYAYCYPLIELGLGLGYLSGIGALWVNGITILVTGIGAFGVFRALQAGLDVRCACMGTTLNVPLSTVTLTEDLGMGTMALLMLIL